MRPIKIAVFALSFIFLTSANNAPDPNLTTPPKAPLTAIEVVKKVKYSVVVVGAEKKGEDDKAYMSVGAGIVVAPGRIITCRHVVLNAIEVTIIVNEEKKLVGKVEAVNPDYDLALVSVEEEGTEWHTAVLSDEEPEVGEGVLAIGHPFNKYRYSVVTGIISGLERRLQLAEDSKLEGIIQTSLPLNGGNSGGPAFNMFGEVIGINCAIRDEAQCISFTVPVSQIKKFLKETVK